MINRARSPLVQKWVPLFVVVWGLACSGGGGDGPTGPPQPAVVSTVSVTGGSSVEVGETTQLSAVARDAGGNSLAGRVVTWASSPSSIASVSDGGVITGLAPGSATVTATIEGKSGAAAIGVVNVAVATVEVTLISSSLVSGRTTQADAILKGAKGQVLTGRTVTWSSSAQGVASVSSSGVITAAGPGSASIAAIAEGKTGSAQLTVVVPPVATITLAPASGILIAGTSGLVSATLQDGAGTVLTGRVVSWASSNTSVATVSSAGLVSAAATGASTIIASSEGVTGQMTVTVTSVGVASVTLVPSAAALKVGDAGYYQVSLRDAAGNILTGRTISWSSSAPGIASVRADGLVSGLSIGTATITAASEGKSGSATVTVSNPPGGPVDVCAIIAGGTIVASDNQFLGSLRNKFNSQSVLNEFGTYGSKFSSTSIWNEFSQYGSQFSSKSAFNPFTTTPPKLLLSGGQTFVWLTVNANIAGPYLNPNFLPTCTNFP